MAVCIIMCLTVIHGNEFVYVLFTPLFLAVFFSYCCTGSIVLHCVIFNTTKTHVGTASLFFPHACP